MLEQGIAIFEIRRNLPWLMIVLSRKAESSCSIGEDHGDALNHTVYMDYVPTEHCIYEDRYHA